MKRPLMERIKIRDFLSMTFEERLALVLGMQKLRARANKEAKQKKGRMTKSAKKNHARKAQKQGKKPVSDKAILKQLEKLTLEELQQLQAIHG